MNIANNKSALLNNSFTSDIQEKICNCLGCNRPCRYKNITENW